MSKKKEYKFFHIGKGIPKNDKSRTPVKGYPNSNLDTYEKTSGKFVSRRKYDENGFAKKDLDKGHPTHDRMTDHAHDFSGYERSESRCLDKQEMQEVNKASKKRRFWK